MPMGFPCSPEPKILPTITPPRSKIVLTITSTCIHLQFFSTARKDITCKLHVKLTEVIFTVTSNCRKVGTDGQSSPWKSLPRVWNPRYESLKRFQLWTAPQPQDPGEQCKRTAKQQREQSLQIVGCAAMTRRRRLRYSHLGRSQRDAYTCARGCRQKDTHLTSGGIDTQHKASFRADTNLWTPSALAGKEGWTTAHV